MMNRRAWFRMLFGGAAAIAAAPLLPAVKPRPLPDIDAVVGAMVDRGAWHYYDTIRCSGVSVGKSRPARPLYPAGSIPTLADSGGAAASPKVAGAAVIAGGSDACRAARRNGLLPAASPELAWPIPIQMSGISSRGVQ